MSDRFFRKSRKQKKLDKVVEQNSEKKVEKATQGIDVYESLEENVGMIKQILGAPFDLIIRHIDLGFSSEVKAGIIYFDEMVSKELVHSYIIRPLMIEETNSKGTVWETVVNQIVQGGETKEVDKMKDVILDILGGDTIILIDGVPKALVVGSKGYTVKAISEPRAENVVRGPREGLSESFCFSLSMIRHRLRDPDLRIKNFVIGTRTQTIVSMLSISGVTDPSIVQEISDRLEQINIDGVLESGYIEEFIQDQTWTPFPQVQNTERPDSVVGHLLEGKVALLIDGTPHALIAPAVFSQFYNSPEDYYERYLITTFLRLVRLLSLFIALFLPALYIAFISFHPEMLPGKLAFVMIAGRIFVPFPSIIEALIMELSVEILREASIRLPGPIGPTIGIVGGLVIGQAAVSAGLVSPTMVIVVGLTTISSYANPSYNAAISVRLLRFPLMILAAMFGLYGITMGVVLIVLHLVQLKSFGVPYLAPFAPLRLSDLKDSLFRLPWKMMNRRPMIYHPVNEIREKGKSESDVTK